MSGSVYNSVNKTQKRMQAIQRAYDRANKHLIILKKWDNNFALFRLISTVILIALIVGAWQQHSNNVTLCLFVFFLCFCTVTFLWHSNIQKKQRIWQAHALSYSLSSYRISRNFLELSKYQSPWHTNNIKVTGEHFYWSDLDITQLFMLLDTCTTPAGSRQLFKLLLNAGILPEEKEKVDDRTRKAILLSKQTKILRYLESIKLNEKEYINK